MILLLLVTLLCYVSDLSASRYRVVRSGRVPGVKQYKRNVKLDDDPDLDLRSVLEEVITDSSEDEEPARITEKLTSRGAKRKCVSVLVMNLYFRIIRNKENSSKTPF